MKSERRGWRILFTAVVFSLLFGVFLVQNVKAALLSDDPAGSFVTELTVPTEEPGRPEGNAAPEPTDTPEQDATPEPTDTPEQEVTPEPTDTPEQEVAPEPTDTPEQEVTPTPPEEPTVTPTPAPKGLVKENGKYRFYKNNGKLLKEKWKRINGRKYYFNKYGNAAIGSKKIGGQYYVFNNKGQLLEPKKLKIVSITSGKYCVDSKGRPRTGWHLINQKLYSVKKTGKIRLSTTYQGIRLTADGSAKVNTNSRLKIKSMEIISRITNNNMTKVQKLRACFNYTMSCNFFPSMSKYPPNWRDPAKDWYKAMALDMMTTRSGTCFGYASMFAVLAKEIGYQPYIIQAWIPGEHCFVKIDGKYYDNMGNRFGTAAQSHRVHKIWKV